MNVNSPLNMNNKPLDINLNIFVNKNQNSQIIPNYNYRPISSISPRMNSSQQNTYFLSPHMANNHAFLYPKSTQQQQRILFPNSPYQGPKFMPNQSPSIYSNKRKNITNVQNTTNNRFKNYVSPFRMEHRSLEKPQFQSTQIKSNTIKLGQSQSQQFNKKIGQKQPIEQLRIQENQSEIDMLQSKNLKKGSQFQSKDMRKIQSVLQNIGFPQNADQNQENKLINQNIEPSLLHCPICQKNYTYKQKQNHIQYHKNRLNNVNITFIPEQKIKNVIEQNPKNKNVPQSSDIFKMLLNYVSSQRIMTNNEKSNLQMQSNQANLPEKAKNMSQFDKSSQDQYGYKAKSKGLNLITPQKIKVNLENSISHQKYGNTNQHVMIPVSYKIAAPHRQNLSPRISQINQIDQSQCFSVQKETINNNVFEEKNNLIQNKSVRNKQIQIDSQGQVSANLKRDESQKQTENQKIGDKLVQSKIQQYPRIKKLPSNKQAYI